jgi:hypothetical protein
MGGARSTHGKKRNIYIILLEKYEGMKPLRKLSSDE